MSTPDSRTPRWLPLSVQDLLGGRLPSTLSTRSTRVLPFSPSLRRRDVSSPKCLLRRRVHQGPPTHPKPPSPDLNLPSFSPVSRRLACHDRLGTPRGSGAALPRDFVASVVVLVRPLWNRVGTSVRHPLGTSHSNEVDLLSHTLSPRRVRFTRRKWTSGSHPSLPLLQRHSEPTWVHRLDTQPGAVGGRKEGLTGRRHKNPESLHSTDRLPTVPPGHILTNGVHSSLDRTGYDTILFARFLRDLFLKGRTCSVSECAPLRKTRMGVKVTTCVSTIFTTDHVDVGRTMVVPFRLGRRVPGR